MSDALTRIEAAADRRLTAHEYVRETLRGAILRGELHGGARLIQAELAAQLNVSTTPVREALRDLASDGFITLDRHRGGVVRQLDWDDMQEILAIRQALEPLAVRLAVERITAEQLERAQAISGQMKRAEVGKWVELNQAFHLVFHEATGAPRLAGILRGLQEASGMYVAQAQRWNPEIRRRANADHQALIDAARRGDAEAALAIQREHVGLPIVMTETTRRRAPKRKPTASAV